MIARVTVLILGLCATSCTKKDVAPNDPAQILARGKSVYIANCTACHNMDPAKDGSIGPAVAGSSLQLLEDRVLKNEYPPGYQPKRQSRTMVALPHLKDSIPALHAYLNNL